MPTETVEIVITERGARATSNSIARVGTVSRTAAASVRLFTGALAAIGVSVGINQLRKLSDTAQQISNRVRSLTTSTEEYNAVQQRLRSISLNVRSPIESVAEAYQKLRVVTSQLGASQKDALDLTEDLTAALKVSGASAETASIVLLQLSQGLGAGLAGDELRSLLENAPLLAQKLAEELKGVGATGASSLRALAREGKLTADVVFPALQRAVAGYKEEVAKLPLTSEEAFTLIRNAALKTADDFNKALASARIFGGSIKDALGPDLSKTFSNALAAIIRGLGSLLSVGADVAKLFESFGINFTTIKGIVQTVISFIKILFNGFKTGIRLANFETRNALFNITKLGAQLGLADEKQFKAAASARRKALQELQQSSIETNEILREEGLKVLSAAAEAFDQFGKDDSVSKGLLAGARSAGKLADELERIAALPPVDESILGKEGENKFVKPLDEETQKARERLRKLLSEADPLAKITVLTPEGEELQAARERLERLSKSANPLAGITTKIDDEGIETLGERINTTVFDSLSNSLSRVAHGEGFSFAKTLSDLSGSLLEDALLTALDSVKSSFGELLKNIPGLSGAAGGLGGAALTAGLGIGLSLISGALKGTKASIQNGLASSSAVQDVQATRGVVAGPTNIPIFQVGASIDAAFQETNEILRAILAAVSGRGQGGSAGTLDAQAGALLGGTGSTLF